MLAMTTNSPHFSMLSIYIYFLLMLQFEETQEAGLGKCPLSDDYGFSSLPLYDPDLLDYFASIGVHTETESVNNH